MSFLEALQKKKGDLKTSKTIIKTQRGEVFLEKRSRSGEFICKKIASDVGYVVDLKPDLEVASVLPGLFMGSQDVTQDKTLLSKHNITHILSVGVQVLEPLEIENTFFEVFDLPEFNINPVFKQTSELISKVIKSGGSVFVHCNAGVSRSAAVVIAYMMKHEKLAYQQAFEILRQARSCIKPNEGFVKQLKLLEKDLSATEDKCIS